VNILAAHTDAAIARLAASGDEDARREAVRRALMPDPAMEREAKRKKREFRVRQDWGWR
jgi:hypothetical protein